MDFIFLLTMMSVTVVFLGWLFGFFSLALGMKPLTRMLLGTIGGAVMGWFLFLVCLKNGGQDILGPIPLPFLWIIILAAAGAAIEHHMSARCEGIPRGEA